MGRCLSLLSMMVFTFGVFALASVAKVAASEIAPPRERDEDAQKPSRPQLLEFPAAATFHAKFSLN